LLKHQNNTVQILIHGLKRVACGYYTIILMQLYYATHDINEMKMYFIVVIDGSGINMTSLADDFHQFADYFLS